MDTSAAKLAQRKARFAAAPPSNKYLELKDQRESLRQRYIDQGKLQDPLKPVNLNDAITVVGECMDMCPSFEIHEREYQRTVDKNEKKDGSFNQIDPAKAVKAYSRSAAGKMEELPCDVRPPHILVKTCNYLMGLLKKITASEPFESTYFFIRDRLRAIQKDFTYQHYDGPERIEVTERTTRYHIMASHFMADNKTFSMQQENELMCKALVSLIQVYDDNCTTLPYTDMNEIEFRALHLLSHPYDEKVERKTDDLSTQLKESPWLKAAMILQSLMKKISLAHKEKESVNSVTQLANTFFHSLRRADCPFLLAAICEPWLSDVRKNVFRAYVASNENPLITPSDLVKLLAYDNVAEVEDDLSVNGISFTSSSIQFNTGRDKPLWSLGSTNTFRRHLWLEELAPLDGDKIDYIGIVTYPGHANVLFPPEQPRSTLRSRSIALSSNIPATITSSAPPTSSLQKSSPVEVIPAKATAFSVLCSCKVPCLPREGVQIVRGQPKVKGPRGGIALRHGMCSCKFPCRGHLPLSQENPSSSSHVSAFPPRRMSNTGLVGPAGFPMWPKGPVVFSDEQIKALEAVKLTSAPAGCTRSTGLVGPAGFPVLPKGAPRPVPPFSNRVKTSTGTTSAPAGSMSNTGMRGAGGFPVLPEGAPRPTPPFSKPRAAPEVPAPPAVVPAPPKPATVSSTPVKPAEFKPTGTFWSFDSDDDSDDDVGAPVRWYVSKRSQVKTPPEPAIDDYEPVYMGKRLPWADLIKPRAPGDNTPSWPKIETRFSSEDFPEIKPASLTDKTPSGRKIETTLPAVNSVLAVQPERTVVSPVSASQKTIRSKRRRSDSDELVISTRSQAKRHAQEDETTDKAKGSERLIAPVNGSNPWEAFQRGFTQSSSRAPDAITQIVPASVLPCFPAASVPAPSAASVPAPSAASITAPSAVSFPAPTAASVPAPSAASVPAPSAASVPAPSAASFPAPSAASFPAPSAASLSTQQPADLPGQLFANLPAPSASICLAPQASSLPVPSLASFPAPSAASLSTQQPAESSIPPSANLPAPSASTFRVPQASSSPAASLASFPALSAAGLPTQQFAIHVANIPSPTAASWLVPQSSTTPPSANSQTSSAVSLPLQQPTPSLAPSPGNRHAPPDASFPTLPAATLPASQFANSTAPQIASLSASTQAAKSAALEVPVAASTHLLTQIPTTSSQPPASSSNRLPKAAPLPSSEAFPQSTSSALPCISYIPSPLLSPPESPPAKASTSSIDSPPGSAHKRKLLQYILPASGQNIRRPSRDLADMRTSKKRRITVTAETLLNSSRMVTSRQNVTANRVF